MINPYIVIAALVIWIGTGLGGFLYGEHVSKLACVARAHEAEAKGQQQKDAEAAKANEASATLEAANEQARIIYKTITRDVDRIVEKPVYRNVCLDDDGLRLANAALSGKATDPGKPDEPMPKPDPSD